MAVPLKPPGGGETAFPPEAPATWSPQRRNLCSCKRVSKWPSLLGVGVVAMVWGLFPTDPLSGEDKYYIFSKGTFKVGRRGCEIIVKKDKGVSRVHAEIIVDGMSSMGPGAADSSNVRVRDLSKYGTFINRNLGSERKVHDNESSLRDGDVVSFGTGNANYRFSFIPLVCLVLIPVSSQVNGSVRGKLSSIGACAVDKVSQDCTHVIVDHSMEVNKSLLDAVVMEKPLVLSSWVESLAEKSIGNDIPSCSSHTPSLAVGGVPARVVDPRTRETCLKGYTFLLEPLNMYEFGRNLHSLLDISGAKGLSIDGYCSTSQRSQDLDNNRVVYVVPGGSQSNRVSKLSVSRMDEKDLLRAILCGHLNPSSLRTPPVVVSSSCSTDETIVADSDVEDETSRPLQEANTVHMEETTENKEYALPDYVVLESEDVHSMYEEKASLKKAGDCEVIGRDTIHIEETTENKEYALPNDAVSESEHVRSICEEKASPKNSDGCVVIRRDKIDESDVGTSDVIYTQDIIVRARNMRARSSVNVGEVNFKRFKKGQAPSGNSFDNLVPFSKFPYKDSSYENDEVAESMKEEKRRKQMEAMAEDLFNHEKGRKRGFAGSLHGLLTRG